MCSFVNLICSVSSVKLYVITISSLNKITSRIKAFTKVVFMGKNGIVYLAAWNNNNFAYTIRIDSEFEGVSAGEMTDYVRETK